MNAAEDAAASRIADYFRRLELEHSAIALAAGLQMSAQGETCALNVSPLNRMIDASVLELNLFKVEPPLFRGF